jgi:hypothetical protein
MNRFIITLVLAVVSAVVSAQTVTPNPVQGIYVPVTVDLPYGGSLRWGSPGVDQGRLPYVTAGACVSFKTSPAYPGLPKLIGYDCTTPAQIQIVTTGTMTSTCPVDGGTSETVHLTLTLDGAVLYDAPLLPGYSPCYNTPPLQAKTTLTFPVLTFDNLAQDRESAFTVFYLKGYMPGNYTFTSNTPTIGCSPLIQNISASRFIKKWSVTGTKCEGTVPASSVSTVTIQ